MDYICNVKYGTYFTLAMPFLDTINSFHGFFGYHYVFKMMSNNFLVESFLIGIVLVIGFQLQSAIILILESFLNNDVHYDLSIYVVF